MADARTTAPRSRETSAAGPATMFAWVFGAIFVIVGIWGFLLTGFDNWAATDTNETVLWFEVNPLHNVVHLLVGGALLAGAAGGERGARAITMLVAVTYTIVGIVGFFATGTDWNVLALNTADNWLHLGTAALGFLAVMASSSQRVDEPAAGRVGNERTV